VGGSVAHWLWCCQEEAESGARNRVPASQQAARMEILFLLRASPMAYALPLWFPLFVAHTVDALPESSTVSRPYWNSSANRLLAKVIGSSQRYLDRTTAGKLGFWEMVQITALCGAIPGIWLLQKYLRGGSRKDSTASSWKSTSKLHPDVALKEEDLTGMSPVSLHLSTC